MKINDKTRVKIWGKKVTKTCMRLILNWEFRTIFSKFFLFWFRQLIISIRCVIYRSFSKYFHFFNLFKPRVTCSCRLHKQLPIVNELYAFLAGFLLNSSVFISCAVKCIQMHAIIFYFNFRRLFVNSALINETERWCLKIKIETAVFKCWWLNHDVLFRMKKEKKKHKWEKEVFCVG